ncbi:MAG: hypothetical protein JWO31_430 [Phycisphaerales bacterium]|nr:hypothetical protein [Phycisphaerales bacterium]
MTTHGDTRPFTRTRRQLLLAAAAGGTAMLLGRHAGAAADAPAAGRPNSVFGGVRVGCNTYSYRPRIVTAEDTLAALLKCGLSEVELKDGPIKAYTGITIGDPAPKGGKPATAPTLTDAERAKLRETQLAKCAELRKLYNDAGVNIHIQKMPFGKTDEEIDFNFLVAKALGCRAITAERDDKLPKRLAPFADKHKIWVAFHNHTNNVPTVDAPDPLLDLGEYVGLNFDVGHYFAGTKGKSPLPVIEKYHDKIVSLHLKDRTAEGRNLTWGTGQTPLRDVLQLLKKEKWPIYADIELEYPVPKESDPVAEVARCVQYCRDALA